MNPGGQKGLICTIHTILLQALSNLLLVALKPHPTLGQVLHPPPTPAKIFTSFLTLIHSAEVLCYNSSLKMVCFFCVYNVALRLHYAVYALL